MNFYDDIGIYGSMPAIICEGQDNISYVELLEIADNIGGNFSERCLIFSLCENTLESVAAYIGFLRARVVPLLISRGIKSELFEGLLRTYRPAFLWLPQDRNDLQHWGTEIYRYGRNVLLKTDLGTDYILHKDLALLLSTSGSTGSPTVVRQSYKNITSNASSICACLEISQEDRPITTLPMNYTYGLSIINSHLLKGCPILVTGLTFMDKGFWDLLRINQVTTFGGVPYVYEMLKRLRFSRMNLPSLKVLTQAGGRLDSELALEFATVCEQKGIRFFVMYGQTEATARMSFLPSEFAISKAGSIGQAILGGEFWLEDEFGKIITCCDVSGELIYRGDNVTMGYATSCHDLSKGDDNIGVLRTGDLAKRDIDGHYTIVGRKKRFLKLFGNRVGLEEVEKMLKQAGFVCLCSGVDDQMRIYTTELEKQAPIKEFVAAQLGIHSSAFTVTYIDAIPRNEAGKILYSELH